MPDLPPGFFITDRLFHSSFMKNHPLRLLLFSTVCLLSLGLTACESETDRALETGSRWFLNIENNNFISYQYFIDTGEWSTGQHPMREMGSMWSLTQMAQYLEDEEILALAEKGMNYYSEHFEVMNINGIRNRYGDTDGDYAYIGITPDKNKLGYNAFTLLTLLDLDVEEAQARVELTNGDDLGLWSEDKERWMELLALGILHQQEDSGEFLTFFGSDRDTGKDYYPGEALLALMKYYMETGDEKYLLAVEKAFYFYSYEYWNGNPNTAFVPWQTQAYFEFYQVLTAADGGFKVRLDSKKDLGVSMEEVIADSALLTVSTEEVEAFIFDMNDYMLEQHIPSSVVAAGTVAMGCTNYEFGGIVSAVYVEGMNKAYALADHVDDTRRQLCYGNFIEEGSAVVLALQFPWGEDVVREAETLFGWPTTELLTEEHPAYGGFVGSKGDFKLQVDRNQHAMLGLMGAKELRLVE
jgi:hypothetical protein